MASVALDGNRMATDGRPAERRGTDAFERRGRARHGERQPPEHRDLQTQSGKTPYDRMAALKMKTATLVLLLVIASAAYAAADEILPPSGWQSGTEIPVIISLRNKYASSPYRVTFTVISPKGIRRRQTVVAKRYTGAEVVFPARGMEWGSFSPDFDPTTGAWRWEAAVDGTTISFGSMRFSRDGKTSTGPVHFVKSISAVDPRPTNERRLTKPSGFDASASPVLR